MKIQKATLFDLEFIYESCNKILEFEKKLNPNLSLNGVQSQEFKSDIAKDLLLDNYVYFLLKKEGKNIGFVCGGTSEEGKWWEYKKIANLDYLYVEEKERTRGAGTQLVEAFEIWAKEQKCDFIKLIAIPENENALKLYKKLGFESHLINIGKNI